MKVLIVHADLKAGGGAEAFALDMAQAATAYGHQVGFLDIHGHQPPDQAHHDFAVFRALRTFSAVRAPYLLIYAFVCRVAQAVARRYDAVIYTYGEGPDMGRPTLCMLHAPALFATDRQSQDFLGHKLANPFRRLYLTICRQIALQQPRPAQTIYLANSRWTQTQAARLGKSVAAVLYPKVKAKPAMRARRRKAGHFVILGRIVPNKRIPEAIAIVEGLRQRGMDAELSIIGRAPGRFACSLMREHGGKPYIRFLTEASDTAIAEVLATASFGLHTYRHEHFGIAVAEMILAGCIPFAYDGGGVCELVPDSELRFCSRTEAIDKIAALMCAPAQYRQNKLEKLRRTSVLQQAVGFEAQLGRLLPRFLPGLPEKEPDAPA